MYTNRIVFEAAPSSMRPTIDGKYHWKILPLDGVEGKLSEYRGSLSALNYGVSVEIFTGKTEV
jgi:hypothetical protein